MPERSQVGKNLTYRGGAKLRITSIWVLLKNYASKENGETLVLEREKTTHNNVCTLWNYPSKLQEIKTFSEQQRLRKFVASRHDLQEMWKKVSLEKNTIWPETWIYIKKWKELDEEKVKVKQKCILLILNWCNI